MDSTETEEETNTQPGGDLSLSTISSILDALGKQCKNIDIDYAGAFSRMEKSIQDNHANLLKKVSLQNTRIAQLEEKNKDLEDDIDGLRVKYRTLKNDVKKDKKIISKLTRKINGGFDSDENVQDVIEKLKLKNEILERRISEIETASREDPASQEALILLNETSTEIRTRFTEWNERQQKLEQEVRPLRDAVYKYEKMLENLENAVKDLKRKVGRRTQKTPVLTPPAPPPGPDSTAGPSFNTPPEHQINTDEEFSEIQFAPPSVEELPPPSPQPIPVFRMPAPPTPIPSSSQEDPFEFKEDQGLTEDHYFDPPSVAPFTSSSQPHLIRPSLKHVVLQRYQHGRDLNRKQEFVCLCKEKFKDIRGLQRHVQLCSRNRRIKCPFCTRHFKAKNIGAHLTTQHKVSVRRSKEATLIYCNPCNKPVAKTWTQFLKHQTVCPGVDGITSTIKLFSIISRSGGGSKNKDVILEHGVNPVNSLCCVCGRDFTTIMKVKQHIRYHQKRFSCDFCGQKFGYNCALKTHLQTKHNTKTNSQTNSNGQPQEVDSLLQMLLE